MSVQFRCNVEYVGHDPATMDQIRVIAEASDIRLRTGGPRAESYEPWDNLSQGLSGIREFVRSLNY